MGGGPAPQTGPGPATAESIAGLERGPAADMLPEAVVEEEDEAARYSRWSVHAMAAAEAAAAEEVAAAAVAAARKGQKCVRLWSFRSGTCCATD